MQIPSHQIQNVLKVYSKQLSQGRMIEGQKDAGSLPSVDMAIVPANEKRQAIIDRVTAEIVEKITSFGPHHAVDHQADDGLRDELRKPDKLNPAVKGQFVFRVIDDNNRKTTNTLSVEDSSFLIQRLEKLAREAVEKNMESENS